MNRLVARGIAPSLVMPLVTVAFATAVIGCELLIHSVTAEATDAGDASGSDGSEARLDGRADAPIPDGSVSEERDAAAPTSACGPLLPDGATRAGPAMVRIDASAGSYCIDSTEVTVAEFNAYVLDSGALIDTPDGCAGAVTTLLADEHAADQDLPVSNIGECYAWSYCRWAKKRLCGVIGDGGVVESAQPQNTEWYYACINGARNTTYPYGEQYDAEVCDTAEDGAAPVGTHLACHGLGAPFDQIFDMSGNVSEYVNDIGADNLGNVRPLGGSWENGVQASCGFNVGGGGFYGLGVEGDTGFRCCADVP
jgi:sulfatase modifying factor 1